MSNIIRLLKVNPVMLALLVLGFVSGLPLALTASTLTAMLSDSGIDIKAIGLFALVSISYACKFVWAPLVDNIKLPILHKMLGRRKSWLIVIQCCLLVAIFSVSQINIKEHLISLAGCCLLISFFSATQDIIIDAFRIEMLKEDEQALGVTLVTFGYRLGMLASGAGSLYLAFYYGWQFTYSTMALLIIPGMIVGLLCKDRQKVSRPRTNGMDFKRWIYNAYLEPLKAFALRQDWVYALLLIIFYKMSDAYIGSLTNKFLQDTGFTLIQIAKIVKIFGLVATFLGIFVAGVMFKKLTLRTMLYIGLVLQVLSNFAYIPIHYAGADERTLMVGFSIENFCSGLSNVVLVAYISTICNLKFTATHYAFLSSLAALTRASLASTSGFLVSVTGWPIFFVISAFLSLPALFFIKRAIKA